jgi:NAD(P)-dependent dehydrogenase (short-subunit alcohol dehydrogenase family)
VSAPPSVQGKVIAITGGASGIGLATARFLSGRGARLVLIDLDEAVAAQAAESLAGEALGLAADVTDSGAIAVALMRAAERFGRLDVVVANAGVAPWGPALVLAPETWERNLEVNLLGAWRTARAAIPYLLESGGYLLFTASVAAAVPMPGGSAYGVSKAGVESLGRTLRIELASHGIDVGVAYYAFLDTPMVGAVAEHPGFAVQLASIPPPLNRVFPVRGAAEVTANGIARRAPRIMYPRLVRPLLAMRGLLGPRALRSMYAAMPEVERLAREESAKA